MVIPACGRWHELNSCLPDSAPLGRLHCREPPHQPGLQSVSAFRCGARAFCDWRDGYGDLLADFVLDVSQAPLSEDLIALRSLPASRRIHTMFHHAPHLAVISNSPTCVPAGTRRAAAASFLPCHVK